MSFTLLGILNAQAAGGGGSKVMELLGTIEGNFTSASFNLDPTDYALFRLHILLADNNTSYLSSESVASANIRFNNDTGNNYGRGYRARIGSSQSAYYNNGNNSAAISIVGTRQSGTGYKQGFAIVDIPFPGSSQVKTPVSTAVMPLNNSDSRMFHASSLFWSGTDPITNINIFTSSGSYIKSRISVYGVRK